jgi:hypothetical protein
MFDSRHCMSWRIGAYDEKKTHGTTNDEGNFSHENFLSVINDCQVQLAPTNQTTESK